MSASQHAGTELGPHILIADDSADMRLYIEGCLRALGPVHVVKAADGRAALHLAHAVHPALVIAERTLPGLSSRMLCQTLHADARTRGIPVLIISSETQHRDTVGDGFLAKPFNAARLHAEVERLLGRPLASQHPLP